jgi:hypothetical protein
MKISKFILALFSLALFASCNKDNDDDVPSTGIEGRWVGTYVNDASGNTFYYSFNIKSNGVIEEINSSNQVVGTGTWQLNTSTNVFMAKYAWSNGQDFSVIAAYDKNAKKLIGDWGYDDSNTDGGSWEMTKSN